MVWLLYGWLNVPIIALKLFSPVAWIGMAHLVLCFKAPPSGKSYSAKVEVDGFFTLPHAQESRFSSILARPWRICRGVSILIYPYGAYLPTFMEDTYLRQVLANEILMKSYSDTSSLGHFFQWKRQRVVLSGALECQQQCAKTYRCEPLDEVARFLGWC